MKVGQIFRHDLAREIKEVIKVGSPVVPVGPG